jgi:hypothetical protein
VSAQDSVPLAQGSYNGTVDVTLSMLVSQPNTRWDYSCTLSFYNSTLKVDATPGSAAWITPKAGTAAIGTATGSVTIQ